jgi:hypothetical protein
VDANIGSYTAHALDIVAPALVLGAGATAGMDLWAIVLRRFGISSLDYAMLGRWIGHLVNGRFRHESIARSAPVRNERMIGWVAHYTIGVTFAALLLATAGPDWLEAPTVGPALLVSYATLVAPFFVMQPGMGAGIAGSKTPRPNVTRLRSIVTHSIYGLGLYVSACIWTVLAR